MIRVDYYFVLTGQGGGGHFYPREYDLGSGALPGYTPYAGGKLLARVTSQELPDLTSRTLSTVCEVADARNVGA
jgi:hypothetical protein